MQQSNLFLAAGLLFSIIIAAYVLLSMRGKARNKELGNKLVQKEAELEIIKKEYEQKKRGLDKRVIEFEKKANEAGGKEEKEGKTEIEEEEEKP